MPPFLADRMPNVDRIVLLNRAFGFPEQWLKTLRPDTVDEWKKTGWHNVYHYGYQEDRRVHWELIQDLLDNYNKNSCIQHLQRPVPTLIVHGTNDPVIPVEESRSYAQTRDHVRLVEYDSGHTLTNVLDAVMEETSCFLRLTSSDTA